MYLDLILAILHHLLVFLLAAVLAAEFVLMRPGLSGRDLRLLGHIDGAYGGVAAAVIAIGVARVIFGLRGWEYYIANHSFWAKMIAFAIVGLLSIRPTMRILAWRRAAASEGTSYTVPDAEIRASRRLLHLQIAFFALIPVFAAMMARSVG